MLGTNSLFFIKRSRMKIKTNIFLSIFAIITLLDYFTAYAIKLKSPIFNETNPIFLSTNMFGLVLLAKIFVIIIAFVILNLYYNKTNEYGRYIIITILCIMLWLQFVGMIGNILEYKKPVEEIKPIPKDIKVQHYETEVRNPSMYLFAFMFFVYVIFKGIEREQTRYPYNHHNHYKQK